MSEDAGIREAEDAHDWMVEAGLKKLEQGREQIQQVETVVAERGATPEAEAEARAALVVLRSAMDWLEDSEFFGHAHIALDEAGAFIRATFGCWLYREESSYQRRCPVDLAHSRIGMSASFIIEKSECTICHMAPETCSHVAGRRYDGEFCARLITQARLLEISFVGRPAQPDARIERISVPVSEIQETVGLGFVPGMDVSCDRCLTPCRGLSRPHGLISTSGRPYSGELHRDLLRDSLAV